MKKLNLNHNIVYFKYTNIAKRLTIDLFVEQNLFYILIFDIDL